MVKSEKDVVAEFNEYVNMSADELEKWLKTPESKGAGWPKSEGEANGNTIGHDSGEKIVEILRANPSKDPKKYTDEQKEHMRKVVSYCARHLAQEAHMKEEKTEEELEATKSTKSLRNWGHDPLKPSTTGKPKSSKKAEADEEDEEEEEENDDEGEDNDDDDDAEVGEKRKRPMRKSAIKARELDPNDFEGLDDYNSEEDDDYESPADDGEEGENGAQEGDEDEEEDDDDDDEEEDGEEEAPARKRSKRS